ncbi:MAG: sulfite exporter TauE/SafE family protein [Alphaproteobacteria bacterium]|nr:sulfite exporter TauE/SafE family protein [Alphaproteobacteria bacterium]
MIVDPLFYALAVPAILVAGISKGGFGSGVGLVAVPMMALSVPVPQAAAIMLPILCIMDLVGLWTYWRRWDGAVMAAILPASLAGIAVGALTFRMLNEDGLRLGIGVLAIAFVLDHWLGWRPRGSARPNTLKAWACSALSGYTSFVAHAGGPPINMYLLPLGMQKATLVATAVVFFACVNYAKLLPYWWLGQLSAGNMATALVLAPLAPIGMLSGVWLMHRVSQQLFMRICYGFVLVTGLKLAWDGARWLLG